MERTPSGLLIVLDLPPKELSPNYTVGSRPARLGKAAKIKAYRRHACEEAQVACAQSLDTTHGMPWEAATVQATFYFAQNRRRDADNLLASLKAAFDGLRDSGVLADDDQLTHLPVQRRVDKVRPRVQLFIAKDTPHAH
jgi:Holliday junction resolvase RusA-like endonuclease